MSSEVPLEDGDLLGAGESDDAGLFMVNLRTGYANPNGAILPDSTEAKHKVLMSSNRFSLRYMIGVVVAKMSLAPVFSRIWTSSVRFSRYFSGVCRMWQFSLAFVANELALGIEQVRVPDAPVEVDHVPFFLAQPGLDVRQAVGGVLTVGLGPNDLGLALQLLADRLRVADRDGIAQDQHLGQLGCILRLGSGSPGETSPPGPVPGRRRGGRTSIGSRDSSCRHSSNS